MILLEILILASILAFIWTRPAVCSWRKSLRPGDLNLFVFLAAIVAGGHFLAADARLFPLVQWRMYTQPYQPNQIEWAEVDVTWSDNTTETINLAHEFPTLARNYIERLTRYVKASQQAKFNEGYETTYRQLLCSFADKLNSRFEDNQVREIRAALVAVKPHDKSSYSKNVVDRFACVTSKAGLVELKRIKPIESSTVAVLHSAQAVNRSGKIRSGKIRMGAWDE